MTDASITDELTQRWVAAWPAALAAWSRHVQLRTPQLCLRTSDAAKQGLEGSFAMIRLQDQTIVIDLQQVRELGLENYGVEVLAHEIGHHVLAPANLTDHARSLAIIRKGLPTLEQHAPLVANLYTDLLINDRLQRSAELRLADVFKKMKAHERGAAGSSLWTLYLRMYELLWSLQRGELTGVTSVSDELEGDAWLGMRVVRHFARNWLNGAGMFATLLLPYFAKDALEDARTGRWHDTRAAGVGGSPSGLTDADPLEQDGIHPSQDSRITGATNDEVSPTPATGKHSSTGQSRQPFEYGEILRATGLQLSDAEIAVRYYREKAAPHLVPFPQRKTARRLDPLPEGIEPWSIGDAFDTIDWMQTVLASPRIIPGMTTMQRTWGHERGADPKGVPLNLDVYIDSSGSMANPQIQLSYPTLAGAILCLSALRAGARVQVTVWSGKHQYTSTPGFVRDAHEVLNTLVAYFGGGTQFPLHIMRETHLRHDRTKRRPAHVLVISDDGVTTMFDRDEQGHSGYELLRATLAATQGGATFVLNLHDQWETQPHGFQHRDQLVSARDELGVDLYTIRDWSELIAFARRFAQKTYAQDRQSARLESTA